MAEWSFYTEPAPRLGWERLSSMSLASLQMSWSMCPKAISRVYAVMVWFTFPFFNFFALSTRFRRTGETFGVSSMCHVIWNLSANKDLFSFYTTTTFGLRLFLYHLSCFPYKSPSILSCCVELYWFVFALLGPHWCPCRVCRSREQSGGESGASVLAAAGHPAQHHHHLHHNRRGQQRARASQSPHRH